MTQSRREASGQAEYVTLAEWDAASIEQRGKWLSSGHILCPDDAERLRLRVDPKREAVAEFECWTCRVCCQGANNACEPGCASTPDKPWLLSEPWMVRAHKKAHHDVRTIQRVES